MGTKKIGIALSMILAVALAANLSAQEPVSDGFRSLSRQEVELVGDGTRGPYFLQGSFILVGTEKVRVNGKFLARGKDYQIDYNKCTIIFSRPVPQGTKFRVKYQRLPIKLKQRYSHRKLVIEEGNRENIKVVEETPSFHRRGPSQEVAGLRVGGSKSFGISVCSGRDPSLEQALRVNISGKVARDVKVVALLSDETSPIQPEGNTQTLEELDRVFMEVRGTNLKATMGDYNLSFQDTELSRFNRKLEGVRGEADYPSARVIVAGAVSKGEFTINRFNGVEGKQGPYQLWGKDGSTDIVVLAGTEKVWVDGERMVRGENNDYVIDYSSGQISFTRHRLITSKSRIVVDFEYSNRRYKRNLYCGRGMLTFWDDRLQLGTTFIREADDKDSPLGLSISGIDRSILEEAGDDSSLAWKGPDSARVHLPMPTSHSLYGLDLIFSPFDHSQLRTELAFSKLDLNTFSDKDDGRDNLGGAYKLAGSFKPRHLRVWGLEVGDLDLLAKYRFLGRRFNPLGRIDPVEYDRKWDLPRRLQAKQEKAWEIGGAYRPLRGSEVKVGLGRIERGDEFRAIRREFCSKLNLRPYPTAKYRLEMIDSDWKRAEADSGTGEGELIDRWVRQRLKGSHTLWKLRPRVGFESELKEQFGASNSGFRFYEVKGGLSTVGLGKVAASVDYEYRDDDRFGPLDAGQGGWFDESSSRTWTNRFALREWHNLSLTAEYTHRSKSFQRLPDNDQLSDLADFKVNYSPLRRAVSTELHYQISNLQAAKKERQFEDVGEWSGDYRQDKDSGEYIYDPGHRESRYVLRLKTTGNFEPVTELKASARLRLAPIRILHARRPRAHLWSRLASHISTDTFLKVEELSREKDKRSIYLLDFDKFQRDKTTIRGNTTIRQDLFLFPTWRHFNLRLRYRRNDDEDNQFLSGREERLWLEKSIRARWWLGRLAFQLDYGWERINRRVEDGFTYDIKSHAMAGEVSYRPQPQTELSLSSEYVRNHDAPSGKRSLAMTLSPKVSYSFRGKGRAEADFEWAHVSAEPKGATLPYRMADGKGVGNTFGWNLRMDYRLNRYLTCLVSYSGRNGQDRKTTHSGRAELRAYF